MRERFLYSVLSTVARCVAFLPARLRVSIAREIGAVVCACAPRHVWTATKNLCLVFPEKDILEIDRIARASIVGICETVFEIFSYKGKQMDPMSVGLVVENDHLLRQMQDEGGILAACHMGNWELLNAVGPHFFDFHVIVKRQENQLFDRFLHEFRVEHGVHVVYADDPRAIIKALDGKHVLATTFDRGFTGSKVFVSFFGKKVPVPFVFSKQARKHGIKVYPVGLRRENGKPIVTFTKAIDPAEYAGDAECAQAMAKEFEDYLRIYPEGYLWAYRRNKIALNQHLLILSDRKPGHVNQSLALAKAAADAMPGSVHDVIELDISRTRRFACDAVALIAGKWMSGKIGILSMLIGRERAALFVRYCDAIISAGSSLSSLNRVAAYVLDARAIAVMRPHIAASRFDRIFMPEHDTTGGLRNIVAVCGAAAYIAPEEADAAAEQFVSHFGLHTDVKRIGVVIGGPADDDQSIEKAEALCRAIDEYAAKNGYRVLVTTSRRTPQKLDDAVEKVFMNKDAVVIANKKNFPFVFKGIVALSDFVVATADSVSMISEAASLKPVAIADVFDTCAGSKKHDRFVAAAVKSGCAVTASCERFENDIAQVFSCRPTDTRERLMRGIKGMF